jgi:hypothetical protein
MITKTINQMESQLTKSSFRLGRLIHENIFYTPSKAVEPFEAKNILWISLHCLIFSYSIKLNNY